MTASGPFAAITSPHTGRSPNDKFIVQEPGSSDHIWWGKVNQPISAAHYERLKTDVEAHLQGQELFVRDVYAGADATYRLPIRFITPNAWHALFVYNMFLRPADGDLARFKPGFQVLHAPELHADPAVHGTKSETFIVINLAERTILIGGTRYAGELKKSIFSILNYLLPRQGVLSMHCSANVGSPPAGDCALFFGLSGTGKTTLSADPERRLIGDDEHGWSDQGIFNFEGGCYAKVIRLSRDGEPEIYATTEMFGTVLENVDVDPQTYCVVGAERGPLESGSSPVSEIVRWRLSTEVSQTQVAVGTPIQLRVILEGHGNLKSAQVPKLSGPAALKIYEPTTTDKLAIVHGTLGGKRVQEYVVLPQQTGAFTLKIYEAAYKDSLVNGQVDLLKAMRIPPPGVARLVDEFEKVKVPLHIPSSDE